MRIVSGGYRRDGRKAVDLPVVQTLEINMSSATALYRNYSIDLAQDVQGWRVVGVTHCVMGSRLLPPAFCYPDRSTAQRYARAAVDAQNSERLRR